MKEFKHILLIDDDDDFNFLNKFLLSDLDLCGKITTKEAADEALNFLVEANDDVYPDLILVDLKMPVMDGFEFIGKYEKAALNNKFPRTKLFVLSSSNYQSDYDRAMSYKSVNGVLEKPLDIKKIKAIKNN